MTHHYYIEEARAFWGGSVSWSLQRVWVGWFAIASRGIRIAISYKSPI